MRIDPVLICCRNRFEGASSKDESNCRQKVIRFLTKQDAVIPKGYEINSNLNSLIQVLCLRSSSWRP